MPQKEASPFLDKKIAELEVKLADMEDADDDMEEMDDDEEAPETPSMPQMQTPLASDMEIMPYTPSQVPRHLQHAQIVYLGFRPILLISKQTHNLFASLCFS